MAFGGRKSHGLDEGGGGHGDELMITPLLDLFVALIPFLIISAVLTRINTVDVGIAKPVAARSSSSQNDFDLLVKVSESRAEVFLQNKKQSTVELADVEKGVEDLRLKLVDIKRTHPDEFKIRIEPIGKAKLELLMLVMDAARKLKSTDKEITRKNEKGETIRLQFLFPNVILRGVYS